MISYLPLANFSYAADPTTTISITPSNGADVCTFVLGGTWVPGICSFSWEPPSELTISWGTTLDIGAGMTITVTVGGDYSGDAFANSGTINN